MSALSIGIPIVVKLVERFIGRGKGPEKKSKAREVLKLLMETIAGQGVGLPDDDELGKLIDHAVASMNQNKTLIGEGTVVAEGVTDAQLATLGLQMIQQGMALLKRGGIE